MYENKKIRNTNIKNEKILYVINDNKIKLNLEHMLDGNQRFFGSKSLELIYMAEGKLDLLIYPKIEIWDYSWFINLQRIRCTGNRYEWGK